MDPNTKGLISGMFYKGVDLWYAEVGLWHVPVSGLVCAYMCPKCAWSVSELRMLRKLFAGVPKQGTVMQIARQPPTSVMSSLVVRLFEAWAPLKFWFACWFPLKPTPENKRHPHLRECALRSIRCALSRRGFVSWQQTVSCSAPSRYEIIPTAQSVYHDKTKRARSRFRKAVGKGLQLSA